MRHEWIAKGTFEALARQCELRTQDAVAYRFWAGESLEDIRRVYSLTKRETEAKLRAFMNRKAHDRS